jgi:hypothetical protein
LSIHNGTNDSIDKKEIERMQVEVTECKKRLEVQQNLTYANNGGQYIEASAQVLTKNLDLAERMMRNDSGDLELKPDATESEDSDLSISVDKKLRKSNMMRLNKTRTNNSIKAMESLRSNYIQWYDNGEGQRR